MANEQPKSGPDWSAQTKWIVLGVVALAALVLFKTEIGKLLGDAGEVEITTSGVKIKTVQTLLGKAEVSNVAVRSSAAQQDGIRDHTFSSRQHGFQIAWPDSVGWSASDTMGQAIAQQQGFPPTVSMPLVVLRNEPVGNFRPNVNVVVEKTGSMSLRAYFDATLQALQQQGWQILTQDIDESSQGAFISFFNSSSGTKIYQFQRYAIARGNAYVITASQLPPEDALSAQLKLDLLSILNSFRTLDPG